MQIKLQVARSKVRTNCHSAESAVHTFPCPCTPRESPLTQRARWHAEAVSALAPPRKRLLHTRSAAPFGCAAADPHALGRQPAASRCYPVSLAQLSAPLPVRLLDVRLRSSARSARASSSTGALSEPSFEPPQAPRLWGLQHSMAPSLQARRAHPSPMLLIIIVWIGVVQRASQSACVQAGVPSSRQADASGKGRDRSPLNTLGRALSSKCGMPW